MRLLSLFLVMSIALASTFQYVQAAPLSNRTQRSFKYSAAQYGIPDVLIYGVLEDNAEAMIVTSKEYLLKKAIPEDRRRGKYDIKALTYAVEFLERASELNYLEATRLLLELFSEGIGAKINSSRADRQLKILAQSDNPADMVWVAHILSETSNVKEAAVLYEKALFAGEPQGLAKLCNYYRFGIGVFKNEAKSHACAVFLSKYGLTPDERHTYKLTADSLSKVLSEYALQESADFQQKINSCIYGRKPVSPAALAMFCASGSIEDVEKALNSGTQANTVPDMKKLPSILVAAHNGRGEIVSLLLKFGANPNVADKDGYTPLIWMIKFAEQAAVANLLKHGADVNMADKQQRTALHWAALSELPSMMQLLLSVRCNINALDKEKKTPLILAIQHGHVEAVKLLLKNNADTSKADEKNFTALSYGINHPQIGPLLMQKGVNSNDLLSEQWGPAASAASFGNIKALESLFKNGFSPLNVYNPSGSAAKSILYYAIDRKKYECADMILDNIEISSKSDKDYYKKLLSEILIFAYCKKYEAFDLLIQRDIYKKIIFEKQFALLDIAVMLSDSLMLNKFISLGMDINSRSVKNNDSLLIRAVNYSKIDTIKFLINNGADVNTINNFGNTPLLQVFISEKSKEEIEEIVKLLIDAGAKLNHTNKVGINTIEEAKKYPQIYSLMREKL